MATINILVIGMHEAFSERVHEGIYQALALPECEQLISSETVVISHIAPSAQYQRVRGDDGRSIITPVEFREVLVLVQDPRAGSCGSDRLMQLLRECLPNEASLDCIHSDKVWT